MKHGARNSLALDWYESGLSPHERKRRGHFSTPHALVDQILDACGYTAEADLRHLRVLDPACGSGNFLARAARRLCRTLEGRGLSQREIRACVQRNLWGLDPDPVACFLAEMQVRAELETVGALSDRSARLHIHQADSLTLAWQERIDLLLANPPYLAAKNTDLSHYLQAGRRGQADSYLLFLDLALRIVRPGGWIGLVLPDPVLARANAASERIRLLREYTIRHLWHLSSVFPAEVGAVVIIAQKISPPALHTISWERTRWRPTLELHESEQVAQTSLAAQPGAELRYLLSRSEGQIVEHLRHSLDIAAAASSGSACLLPLNALVDIKRGEELGRTSELLAPLTALKHGLPVLRGGVDLRPYAALTTDLGIERSALKKPIERYLQPKLLVVKSTSRLQAVLDTQGHVVLQTLYLLQLHQSAHECMSKSCPACAKNAESGRMVSRGERPPVLVSGIAENSVLPVGPGNIPGSPFILEEGNGGETSMEIYYYLLALLNSRLLNTYVYYLHTAYKLVQPQIEQSVLARLPVPWGDADARREIAERARALALACSKAGTVVEWDTHLSSLYEEQERAIRALYAAATSEIFADKGVIRDG